MCKSSALPYAEVASLPESLAMDSREFVALGLPERADRIVVKPRRMFLPCSSSNATSGFSDFHSRAILIPMS